MGLEEFTSSTQGTSTTTPQQTTQQQTTQTEEEEEGREEPFKKVSGNRGRHKVFQTEKDWQEAVDFIEDQLGMSVDEVLDMSASDRYQILHQAILQKENLDDLNFHPTRECLVCGERFVFPSNWNFTRLKGEAVCNNHTAREVMREVGAVNALK